VARPSAAGTGAFAESARAPKSKAQPSDGASADMESEKLGTGEGEHLRRRVENVKLELEDQPIAVMTMHYRGDAVSVAEAPKFRIVTPPPSY